MISAQGGRAVFVEADVARPGDCEALSAAAITEFGRLDFACNNAGIGGDQAPTADYPLESWHHVLDVNLSGPFYCMKYQIPRMLETGGGSIVNLSSVAGVMGEPGVAPYVASKHAVIGLTKSAAAGGGADGIRVNAVCPSPIDTRMMRSLEAGFAPGNEGVVKQMLEQRIPLGRYGTPEEVADVIAFLCSHDARFVSGSIYTVDGGMSNY